MYDFGVEREGLGWRNKFRVISVQDEFKVSGQRSVVGDRIRGEERFRVGFWEFQYVDVGRWGMRRLKGVLGDGRRIKREWGLGRCGTVVYRQEGLFIWLDVDDEG